MSKHCGVPLSLLALTLSRAAADVAPVSDCIFLRAINCQVVVYLRGKQVEVVGKDKQQELPLDLAEGANVVGLAVKEAGPQAAVDVRWQSLAGFPDAAGPWLIGRSEVADWLKEPQPPKGFTAVEKHDGRLPVPEGESCLRQLVYVPSAGPMWFPKLNRCFAVQGTRQLIKPYLAPLGMPPAYDCQLFLSLPQGVRAVCCDGGVGARPDGFNAITSADGQLVELRYDRPAGCPFGVYICWQDARKATIDYQIVLSIGGTHDWARLRATVRAPDEAAFARPIVLKWAHNKVVGEAWIDNIAFTEKGKKRNLLEVGDFEGELWEKESGMAMGGPDGSRCLHVTLKEEDGTRGWWVPKETPLRVEGGKTYVVEADVKAEGIHVPGATPHAAILVDCDKRVRTGEYQVTMLAWSKKAGARTIPVGTTLAVLPALKDRRPRSVRIMPCYYSDPFERREVIGAYADNAYASGITWTYGNANCGLAKLLLPRGHKVVCAYGRQPFEISGDAQAYVKEHPEVQALKFNGTRIPTTACPTWFLSDEAHAAREAMRQDIEARLDTGKYAGFNWDIEQPVVEPPNFCVCERCLEAFRRFAAMEGTEVTPETLLKEPLRAKWVTFRCTQNARLVEMVSRWVKDYRPGIEFSVYSGYHNVFTKEHYGVDWESLAPYLDAGMSGYGFSAKDEQATREALGRKPYLAGELYCLSPTSHEEAPPNPNTWANRILRQIAFTGGHGIVIWYLPVFDGAVFYQTSVAAEIIAEHEDFFTRGQRRETDFAVEGLRDNEWFALQLGSRLLLLILNFGNETLTARINSQVWQAPQNITIEPFGRYVAILRKT
jgi:hypothetical protein